MLHCKYTIFFCITIFISTLSVSLSYANPLESVDHINTLAKEFIQHSMIVDPEERLDVNISQASQHFQVTQCDTPIQVAFPDNTSREQIATVEMTCSSPQAWHIYVPIDVRIMKKVIVSKQPIPAKEVITEDMLTYAEFDKNHLYSGYFNEMNEIVGQESVSAIAAGIVLNKRQLQRPILIHRNQNISIVAIRGRIMVKADGIAKSDGAINDMIKVFNPSSKRMIDGLVINGSSVEVTS